MNPRGKRVTKKLSLDRTTTKTIVVLPSSLTTSLSSIRKPSHIPLTALEREKLYARSRSLGLPYATWARATLLAVADWPADMQPYRVVQKRVLNEKYGAVATFEDKSS